MAINPALSDLADFARQLGVATPDDAKVNLKVDDALIGLWSDYSDFVKARGSAKGFGADSDVAPTSGSLVNVDITATRTGESLLKPLTALGLQNADAFGRMVGGQLPIDKLDDVAKIAGVHHVKAPAGAASAGSVLSQGEQAIKADDARALFDLDGTGIKVGVISDSFNTGPGSYAADVISGDLPAGVAVLEDYPGQHDEARAMAQLVYDVAPGSSFLVHTAGPSQPSLANAIIDLRDQGAKVIADDWLYYEEPMFLDGIIAQAVDEVASSGVNYFTSAMNFSTKSYGSPSSPGGGAEHAVAAVHLSVGT